MKNIRQDNEDIKILRVRKVHGRPLRGETYNIGVLSSRLEQHTSSKPAPTEDRYNIWSEWFRSYTYFLTEANSDRKNVNGQNDTRSIETNSSYFCRDTHWVTGVPGCRERRQGWQGRSTWDRRPSWPGDLEGQRRTESSRWSKSWSPRMSSLKIRQRNNYTTVL